jgi:hypothetical protein
MRANIEAQERRLIPLILVQDFFDNLGSILTFAVFGTVISTVIFGYAMYGFALLIGISDVTTLGNALQ